MPNANNNELRFHSRYGLFTYPQCRGLCEWAVLDHFTELGAECIIGREDHVDGGTHLHVFADFGRKRRFRAVRSFDVEGFHPNVQPSRGNPGAGYDYATKDGNIVAGGLERPEQHPSSRGDNASKGEIYAELVSIEDSDTFWKRCQELAPELLLRNFTSIQAFAGWKFRPRQREYTTPAGIEFDLGDFPELSEWRHGNLGESTGDSIVR